MKKITLQLNNFFANKDLVSELHNKKITYKVGAVEATDTFYIENVCEIRYNKEKVYIIVDNFDKSVEINTKNIRYMDVE